MDNIKNTPSPFKITANTWGATKTKLKNKFNQLTDTDLAFEEGKEKELSSRLQTRLNKTAAEVEQLIKTI